MQLFSLQGQVAFVTGAGSGIGQAIAVGLAEAGADVACFDLPGSPGIASTVERIQALGRRALALSGTVTERQVELIQKLIDKQEPKEVVLANDNDPDHDTPRNL